MRLKHGSGTVGAIDKRNVKRSVGPAILNRLEAGPAVRRAGANSWAGGRSDGLRNPKTRRLNLPARNFRCIVFLAIIANQAVGVGAVHSPIPTTSPLCSAFFIDYYAGDRHGYTSQGRLYS